MSQKQSIIELCEKLRGFACEQGFTKQGKSCYVSACKRNQKYHEKHKTWHFAEELSYRHVQETRRQYELGAIGIAKYQYTRKIHYMLKTLDESGKITCQRTENWGKIQLCSEFEAIMDKFILERLESGIAESTATGNKSETYLFLLYFQNKYSSLRQVTNTDIADYITLMSKRRSSGVSSAISSLRAFVKFLYNNGYTDKDFALQLQVIPAIRRKPHFGFSDNEINQLINAVDRNTSIGKRDYAILTLAKHTGLRAVDVFRLKLDDIDWENSEIIILQHKTGRPLYLPLDNSVGNAIADYILHGRPDNESRIIFLSDTPPHKPMGSSSGSSIVRRYAKLVGVTWKEDEFKGFHSFRRSLGVRMLNAEIPVEMIKEVLGHSNIESTKPYLAINHDKLQMCALPLTGFLCYKEELR